MVLIRRPRARPKQAKKEESQREKVGLSLFLLAQTLAGTGDALWLAPCCLVACNWVRLVWGGEQRSHWMHLSLAWIAAALI